MTATLDLIEEQIRSGRHDEARKALDAAAKAGGDRPETIYLRGYLQELSSDREGALTTYQTVLKQDPHYAEALFRASLLSDQYGNEELAVSLLERCAEGDRVPVHALLNLAVLYEEAGRLADAEACLQSVLEEHPDHFRAKHYLKSVRSSYTMLYDERVQREHDQRSAILDVPVTDFELSVRSRNCLRQMDIRTLGDLLRTTEAELLSYKNFGETSLHEIKAMLAQKGLKLGQALQPSGEPAPAALPGISTEAANQLLRPVSELELSVRSRKCLQRLGIATLGELTVRSETELMAIKNFGQTSLSEIKRQLATFGLALRPGA